MGGDIALWMLALLVGMILFGVHIGVSFAICSALGVWLMLGSMEAALAILGNTAFEAVRKDVFAVIPLFVLMGDFVSRSGAAADLYRICDRVLRRLPGRLAIATIAGNTVFAAVTGVSIAAAAAFSRIAYPEMRKLGYKQTFALGAVAGSACPWHVDPTVCIADRLGHFDGNECRCPVHRWHFAGRGVGHFVFRLRDYCSDPKS